MDDDLRDLYQEVILDHGKHPRNYHELEEATCHARGDNPLCGDRLTIYLTVDDEGVVTDASFKGRGCAISVASASLMTELLKGLPADKARRLFEAFHGMVTSDAAPTDDPEMEEAMERLRVLSGVRDFPVRVKCATLAWHTMRAALDGDTEISTE